MGVLRGGGVVARLYVYDVREPGGESVRRRVRKVLRGLGAVRVQYSAYLLVAEREVHSEALERLRWVGLREGDEVLSVPVCRRCAGGVVRVGSGGVEGFRVYP